jgi:BirA family biotin operon repressor/biotin-[acetyl-CoA-carboxylase] ligase
MPSTQSAAKEAARNGAEHGEVFVTDYQNAGRGRRDRGWSSSPGIDLTFSVVLRPSVEMRYAHMLNLAAALSVKEALGKIFPGAPGAIGIKWPNDVLADGKKICGIICESSGAGERVLYAVLGIGVNVNGGREQTPPTDSPDRPNATSVFMETGRHASLPMLLADVLSELEKFHVMVESEERRNALVEIYKRNCSTIGRTVRIISDEGEYTGVAADITSDGALTLQNENGAMTFRAADVVHARIQ